MVNPLLIPLYPVLIRPEAPWFAASIHKPVEKLNGGEHAAMLPGFSALGDDGADP
jgi:hypothetical protein